MMAAVPPSPSNETSESDRLGKNWRVQDFQILETIGKGRYGTVLKSKEKASGHCVAIKCINKTSLTKYMHPQVFNEMAIHSLFQHPHIIPLFTFFHDERHIFLVMEYACHSLHGLMKSQPSKRFSEEAAAKYIYQIADALEHMHSRQYIHRDVKPENILVDVHGNAKLGDFGFVTPSSIIKDYCGTEEYMAPEIIDRRMYDHTVDNWCLGVMTYELLVGNGPFDSKDLDKMKKEILGGIVKFPRIVQPDAKNLILGLANINPKKRISLLKTMNHSWINAHYGGNRSQIKSS